MVAPRCTHVQQHQPGLLLPAPITHMSQHRPGQHPQQRHIYDYEVLTIHAMLQCACTCKPRSCSLSIHRTHGKSSNCHQKQMPPQRQTPMHQNSERAAKPPGHADDLQCGRRRCTNIRGPRRPKFVHRHQTSQFANSRDLPSLAFQMQPLGAEIWLSSAELVAPLLPSDRSCCLLRYHGI